MTATRTLFPVLFAAMTMAFRGEAVQYPPPTNVSFKWLSDFEVNVSWKNPILSKNRVRFLIKKKVGEEETKENYCTPETNITVTFLTEETGSDHQTYNIWTVDEDCNTLNSRPVSITVKTPKPRVEVVKDFKCLVYRNEMNCSWIPVDQSLDLTIYYRICGRTEKRQEKCDQPYRSGKRNGCSLQVNADREDVCILVDTKAGMNTFKAVLAAPSPELSIKEEGDYLKLSWKPPEIGNNCEWTYEVCYRECNEPEKCRNKTKPTMVMIYKKNCLYEFRSKLGTSETCPKIFSDFSEVVKYGTNEPPDKTLTVVAIVIPVILSVCIILSCYCFRRHSAIICPIIPDPSAIFKEMMMNGNKEPKPTTGRRLYLPMPESIDPCKITLVTENSVPQENS